MGKLTIDLPESAHKSLRMLVASRGMTMKQFVMDKLLPDAIALAATMPWEMKQKIETVDPGVSGPRSPS